MHNPVRSLAFREDALLPGICTGTAKGSRSRPVLFVVVHARTETKARRQGQRAFFVFVLIEYFGEPSLGSPHNYTGSGVGAFAPTAVFVLFGNVRAGIFLFAGDGTGTALYLPVSFPIHQSSATSPVKAAFSFCWG